MLPFAIDQVFSVGTETQESIEPMLDSVQLKRFAQEAEVNEDYEAAAKYYQVCCQIHKSLFFGLPIIQSKSREFFFFFCCCCTVLYHHY